jgi:hypothetical protein
MTHKKMIIYLNSHLNESQEIIIMFSNFLRSLTPLAAFIFGLKNVLACSSKQPPKPMRSVIQHHDDQTTTSMPRFDMLSGEVLGFVEVGAVVAVSVSSR